MADSSNRCKLWACGRHPNLRRSVGNSEQQRRMKPLHWYIAARLVILKEVSRPRRVTPRPPFQYRGQWDRGSRTARNRLKYEPSAGIARETADTRRSKNKTGRRDC